MVIGRAFVYRCVCGWNTTPFSEAALALEALEAHIRKQQRASEVPTDGSLS